MTINELKEQNLVLFEAVVGSKAYGLDAAASDTDIKGVYYLPKAQFLGLGYMEQVSNESNDEVYYELGRYVELLSRSNPNMLELLASPENCILVKHPLMTAFQIDQLLSKETVNSFSQYAMVQIRKAKGLNKKINNLMALERKDLLDFCYILDGNSTIPCNEWLRARKIDQSQCGLAKINHTKGMYALFYSHSKSSIYKGILAKPGSHEVSCSSIPKGEDLKAYLFVNHEAYSMYCKSYREYVEWVNKRNETRFSSTLAHGQGYDAKNMMHTMRLLEVSKEILLTGKLQVRRPNRSYLLDVKSGKYAYAELVQRAEDIMQEIDFLLPSADLQNRPDVAQLEDQLIRIRTALYRA